MDQTLTAYENKDFENARRTLNTFIFEANMKRTIFFPSCQYDRSEVDELSQNIDSNAELERAFANQEGGDYLSAIDVYEGYLQYNPDGERTEEIRNKLNEAYLSLFTDEGESGKNLIQNMYDAACGISDAEIPAGLDTQVLASQPKYWYPQVNPALSDSIAQTPAEFRVAVCYTLVQTTDIVETCRYANSSGYEQTAINRMNALYTIFLVDTISHEEIALYANLYSVLPAACPDNITVTAFPSSTPIIGLPNFVQLTIWLNEQMKTIE